MLKPSADDFRGTSKLDVEHIIARYLLVEIVCIHLIISSNNQLISEAQSHVVIKLLQERKDPSAFNYTDHAHSNEKEQPWQTMQSIKFRFGDLFPCSPPQHRKYCDEFIGFRPMPSA